MNSPLRHRLAGLGLALATLATAGMVTVSSTSAAHAAPTSSEEVALLAGSGSATLDGTTRSVIASLARHTGDFDLVGMTWDAMPAGAVQQVRVLGATGWSEWKTLEFEADGAAGAEQRRQGTEPLWTGAATAVEARVLGTAGQTVTGARLRLVNTTALASDASLPGPGTRYVAAATGVTYATRPTIITRAQWGADESMLRINGSDCVPANVDTTIKAAIVHNTAGSNNYTKAQSAAVVRGIYDYHVNGRGWCDIGYNFLVDKYGQIFEGRHGGIDLPIHGAHASSWNTDTVGVSVMMDSNTAVQTEESMASVTKVLAWKLAGNYRDPLSKLTLAGTSINRIAGHGDVMDTDCPGTNIIAYMSTLRQRVATAMGNWKTPIYQAWTAQGGETGKLGSPHIPERPLGSGRVTDFTRGAIYQTPTGTTYWLGAGIASAYASQGRATGWLGWPTSNEVAGPVAGSTQVRFEGGVITSSGTSGSHSVTRAAESWLTAGGHWSRVGLPTGEPVWSSSTAGYQNFQGGRLQWSSASFSIVALGSCKQGDINGDGRADALAVAADGTITWWPTTAELKSGTPVKGTKLAGGPFTWVSQMPDVNGDKYTELVARRTDGTLWAWEGRGMGTFVKGHQIGHGWNGMRELNVVPDMNGDKLPEIIAISGDQNLYRYSLGTTLMVIQTQKIGANWGGIVHMTSVGDFRKVGVTDVLATTADGALLDYFGTRSGGLYGYRQVGHGWGGFTQMRSMGDINNDGQWDLLGNRASGALYGYLNRTGSWASIGAMLPEVSTLGQLA